MTKGLGYLMGKFFHPMTKMNQRRKFIAEQKHADALKKQKEYLEQYRKEAAMREMKGLLCQTPEERERFQKLTPISFIYERPPGLVDLGQEGEEKSIIPVATGDDKPPSPPAVTPQDDKPNAATHRIEEVGATLPAAPARKSDRLEEKFKFLQGAPTQGKYTRDVEVHHRPLGIEVRNVQCARCGGWGHRSGDRECPLHDQPNPNDAFRVTMEDPLVQMEAREKAIRTESGIPDPAPASTVGPLPAESLGLNPEDAKALLAQLSPGAKRRILRQFGLAGSGNGDESDDDNSSSSSDSSTEKKKHSHHSKKSRHRHRHHTRRSSRSPDKSRHTKHSSQGSSPPNVPPEAPVQVAFANEETEGPPASSRLLTSESTTTPTTEPAPAPAPSPALAASLPSLTSAPIPAEASIATEAASSDTSSVPATIETTPAGTATTKRDAFTAAPSAPKAVEPSASADADEKSSSSESDNANVANRRHSRSHSHRHGEKKKSHKSDHRHHYHHKHKHSHARESSSTLALIAAAQALLAPPQPAPPPPVALARPPSPLPSASLPRPPTLPNELPPVRRRSAAV